MNAEGERRDRDEDGAEAARAAQAAKDAYIQLATKLAGDPEAVAEDLREVYERWTEEAFPVPADARVERCELGGVECLAVTAAGVETELTLLHFHGGGFVLGSPRGHRAFAARLSAGAAARVILPTYRLAPEHGPDEPLQDALAAYLGLLAGGTAASDVVISGDSAGGGLALAALPALRDADEPLPAGCVAMSPWTDGTLSAGSIAENAERDVLISPAFLSTLALMRFGPDGERRNPRASPAFADWHGLPPLLLFASTTETLRDDSVAVFERARDAGVNAQLELYEEMVHVWPFFSEWLPEGRRAIDQLAAFAHACKSPPASPR